MRDQTQKPKFDFPAFHLANVFNNVKKRHKKYQEGLFFFEENGKVIKTVSDEERISTYDFLYEYIDDFIGFDNISDNFLVPHDFYGFETDKDFQSFIEEIKDFKSKQFFEENTISGYRQYELEYALKEEQKTRGELIKEDLPTQKHLLSIKLEEETGAIVRVLSLFNRRNYIVESMTFSPSQFPGILNFILVVIANENELNKITRQLKKLIPVIFVEDLTNRSKIERELILIKIKIDSTETPTNLMMLLSQFDSKLIDTSIEALTYQIIGDSGQICNIERLLKDFSILDIVRTGKIGFSLESDVDSAGIFTNNIGRRYLFGKNNQPEDNLRTKLYEPTPAQSYKQLLEHEEEIEKLNYKYEQKQMKREFAKAAIDKYLKEKN